jgi:hypothetical protein
MLLNKYCIAHTLRETNEAIVTIESIREIMKGRGIVAKPPNMGNHITLIPPFRTLEIVAKAFASGMDYHDATQMSNGSHLGVIGVKFDFFRNSDMDAFIIRLKISDTVRRAVERWRATIPNIAEWVYPPPENGHFNPYITVAEGPQLYSQVYPWLREGSIPEGSAGIVSDVEAPRVYVQDESTRMWRPLG